jgi:UDP-glucose 4-epimerase
VHCAARTVVGESLVDPLGYYLENVAKTIVLLQALVEYGCPRVVFTSSAAVYGPDVTGSVGESAPLLAATPYARSKVMIEEVLTDACAALPLTAVSLRCFNPIGSDPKLRSGPYDDAPTHALGQLLLARSSGESFRIHGTDWPTADGTPVRDFVHVWDVALAHVAAVHIELPESGAAHRIVNVGSGHATTVRELAAAFNQYAEPPITVELGPRRAGDGVGSASSVAAAAELLDWHPTLSVTDAVLDVLRWIERHGLGRDPGCA